MDHERYEHEIRRWTAEAARNLDRTRRVALLWAWVAIAAVPIVITFSTVIALTGLAIVAFAVLSFAPLLLFIGVPFLVGGSSVAWELVRSMMMRDGEDRTVRAARRELPDLWNRIDRIALQVGVKPPDELLVEAGFAAYAGTLVPRPFARSVNIVGIGLATIAMLEEDELDAILAHELAHLRGRDSSAMRRVRRALAMWYRIDDAIVRRRWFAEQPDSGRIAGCTWAIMRCTVDPIARVLGPRLPAIDKAIGREQELAADRAAAATIGAEANARVLLKCAARLPVWSRQRDAVYEAALLASASPATDLPMRAALLAAEPLGPWEVRLNVALGLNEPDSIHDEHPALNRRLVMLGIGVDRPATHRITFDEAAAWAGSQPTGGLWARTFDGAAPARLLDRVGAAWVHSLDSSWSEAHTQRVEFDAEARALATRPAQELTAAQCLRIAWLQRILAGRDAARGWVAQAVQVDPHHHDAAFALGRLLSIGGDQQGPAWLAHARKLAPECAPEALALTAAWHRACGDTAGSDALLSQADDAVALLRTAKQTPWDVRCDAPVVDRAAPARERTIVRSLCVEHADTINRAWIARVNVPNPPHGHAPMTILIEVRGARTDQQRHELAQRYEAELHANCVSVALDQLVVIIVAARVPHSANVDRIIAASATLAWSSTEATAYAADAIPRAA